VNRAALLLLPCVLVAAPVLAQTPPSSTGRLFGVDDEPAPGMPASRPRIVMRLAYTHAEGCPEDDVVRATIGAQVRRWDPFAPNAPWRLTVAITHGATGYEGAAELRDVVGAVVWTRALASRPRCSDLVEDLALVVALKINPPTVPVLPPPEPPPPPPEATKKEPPPPPPEPSKPPARAAFRVGLGTWMELATAPRPAFGLTADVGFRFDWFSLAAEFRWDPPAGATVMAGVDVSTALVTGALVPCGHYRWAVLCLVGELGQIQGGFSLTTAGGMSYERASFYGRGGGRFGFEIPVVPDRLFVRLAANLLGAPWHPRSWLDPKKGAPAVEWESPAVTAGFGAGLLAAF
jgi:hypothetical protein